ncbi:MAG: D-alanine--D-alanine ligase family protein [bacterium]
MPKKTKKIRVGIIFGGRSAEHEISLISAKSIYQALDKAKYQPFLIGITRQGKWVLENKSHIKTLTSIISDKPVFLSADPSKKALLSLNGKKVSRRLNVIFPVLHGPYGEDGCIQGLFELSGIPYVGSGVLGSAVGMDKVVQKDILRSQSIEVVKYLSFNIFDWNKSSINILTKINKTLKPPLFIKPANLGSSVGISLVKENKFIKPAINKAFEYDTKIIVEQGVIPLIELECAVLGNDSPIASGVGEIIPSDEFYSYHAKYLDNKSKTIIPAKITKVMKKRIQNISTKAFKALNLSGMARIDFLLGGHKLYLNEVNTLPGFTSISMYPKLWQAENISYSELIDNLITLALDKHDLKQKIKNQYQSSSR